MCPGYQKLQKGHWGYISLILSLKEQYLKKRVKELSRVASESLKMLHHPPRRLKLILRQKNLLKTKKVKKWGVSRHLTSVLVKEFNATGLPHLRLISSERVGLS
jgi:hypothetical protein